MGPGKEIIRRMKVTRKCVKCIHYVPKGSCTYCKKYDMYTELWEIMPSRTDAGYRGKDGLTSRELKGYKVVEYMKGAMKPVRVFKNRNVRVKRKTERNFVRNN
jgi:hypothetical protein